MSGVSGLPDAISLWALAAAVLRARRRVAALALALAVLAAASSLMATRRYVASATFVPQERAAPVGGLTQLASQFGLAAAQPATGSPAFYADVLTSRQLLREVVLSGFDVRESRPFRGTLVQYFLEVPDTSEASVRKAVRALRGALEVTTDRTTGVVRLSVRTASGGLSASVAERFLGLLNEFNLARRQSGARAEREFIEGRLQDSQAELNRAEDTLAAFLQRNRRYQDSPELLAQFDRLQRQVSFRQTVYVTLAQNYETAKIEEVRNTPALTVIERPNATVEPVPRYTPAKVMVGLLLGVLIGVAWALVTDRASGTARELSPDYAEFAALLREAWRPLAFWRRAS